MDSTTSEDSQQSWHEGESTTSDSEQFSGSSSSSQSKDQNILTPQKIKNNKRLYYEKVEEDSGIKVCKVEGCKKSYNFLRNLLRHCRREHKKNSKAAIEINKKSYGQERQKADCKICNKRLSCHNISRHLELNIEELKVKPLDLPTFLQNSLWKI